MQFKWCLGIARLLLFNNSWTLLGGGGGTCPVPGGVSAASAPTISPTHPSVKALLPQASQLRDGGSIREHLEMPLIESQEMKLPFQGLLLRAAPEPLLLRSAVWHS